MSVLNSIFFTNVVLFVAALLVWAFPRVSDEETRVSKFVERVVVCSGLAFPVIVIVMIWSNVK